MKVRHVLLMTVVSVDRGVCTGANARAYSRAADGSSQTPRSHKPPAPTAAPAPTSVPPTAAPKVGVTWKIGFISAATGAAASLGVPERDVARIVADQLKATGITGPDGASTKSRSSSTTIRVAQTRQLHWRVV